MSDPLRPLDAATRASPAATARLARKLDSVLAPEDLKALLRAVPGPAEGAAARVRARTLQRLARPVPTPRRGLRPALLLLGASAAFAAAALLGPDLRAPAPLAGPVAAGPSTPAAGLALQAAGAGELAGDAAAPTVRWRDGRLDLDATGPVTVETREARVTAAGAHLALTRDRLGSHVAVATGRARVRCLAGETVDLGPDTAQTCLPVSPAGMLGRARALQEAGARPPEVLAAVTEGLARPGGDPVTTAELVLLQGTLLAGYGRPAAALAAVEATLDGADPAGPRVAELHHLAAALALGLPTDQGGGCARARPHLAALATRMPPDPDAAARLAACGDPLPGGP